MFKIVKLSFKGKITNETKNFPFLLSQFTNFSKLNQKKFLSNANFVRNTISATFSIISRTNFADLKIF